MPAQAVERQEPVGEMADGTPVALPVIAYDAGDGPSVFIGCSIHGDEVTGQASLWRLRDDLTHGEMRGRVTLVPVMNPLGFNYNVRGVPLATLDLNRLYPGDANGSLAERVTAKVWALARGHDVVVDVHTAGWAIPHILLDPVGGDLRERVEDLAYSTGVTVLDEYEKERYELQNLARSLPGVALQAGKPAFTLELGGFKGIDWSSVDAGHVGLRNLLVHLDVLEGKLRPVTSAPVIRERGYRRRALFAPRGGLLRYEEVPGAKAAQDALVAVVHDPFGRPRAEVRMPEDGYVVGCNAASVVPLGGYVAEVAVRREG